MEVGCPPGTLRDIWFRFPYGRNVSGLLVTEPCTESKSAFVALLSLAAILCILLCLLTLPAVWLVKARNAKLQLALCLPWQGSMAVLCTASAADPGGTWNALGSQNWVLFGIWCSVQYYHILINTSTIRKVAAAAIPKGLQTPLDLDRRFDIVQTGLLIFSAGWITIQFIAFCIMIPLSQVPMAHYTTESVPSDVKDFWFALGCFCHPIATVAFIFIPFRHSQRLLSFTTATREAIQSKHRNDELALFEYKLKVGLIQAVVSGAVSQTLWLLVADQRIFGGLRWYLVLVLCVFGYGFHLTILALFAPKRMVPRPVREWLIRLGANTREGATGGTAPRSQDASAPGNSSQVRQHQNGSTAQSQTSSVIAIAPHIGGD